MIKILNSKDNVSKLHIKAFIDRSNMDESAPLADVKEIINSVRATGDEGLFKYTNKFDCKLIDKNNVKVTEAEILKAYELVDEKLLNTMRKSAENIRNFHQKQKQNTWLDVQEGKTLGMLINPVSSVGVYVPGGKAAYPSSVLMNVIPAVVAGVLRIVMVTPPAADGSIYPLTLVAAKEAGVHEIYKVGGAQAIAALAFGTQSIKKVDKITGPGNIYVALAKREVFGFAGIDMIAGPSEVLIIADSTANPKYIAADMLAQAEHDELAAAVLVTNSERIARETADQLQKQIAVLERAEIAKKSIENHSAIIITKDIAEAVEIANGIAPEHLEVLTAAPFELLGVIKNAGAVFLGEYSPESLGDYFAGTNHVLPTGTSARFFSPLSVDDFIKKTSVIYYTKPALKECIEDINTFARAEGLTAHAISAQIRGQE